MKSKVIVQLMIVLALLFSLVSPTVKALADDDTPPPADAEVVMGAASPSPVLNYQAPCKLGIQAGLTTWHAGGSLLRWSYDWVCQNTNAVFAPHGGTVISTKYYTPTSTNKNYGVVKIYDSENDACIYVVHLNSKFLVKAGNIVSTNTQLGTYTSAEGHTHIEVNRGTCTTLNQAQDIPIMYYELGYIPSQRITIYGTEPNSTGKRIWIVDGSIPTPVSKMVYNKVSGAVGMTLYKKVEGNIAGFVVNWGNPKLTDGWVSASTVAAVPAFFTDVTLANSKFFYWIQLIKLANLINAPADGAYDPSLTISRGEVADIVALVLEKAGILVKAGYANIHACALAAPKSFPDVPSGHQYHDDILCLVTLNILSGFSDGTFKPDLAVDRQAMSKYIAGSLKWAGVIPDYDSDQKLLGADDDNGNKIDDDLELCAARIGKTFSDVPSSNVFSTYISCIAGLGIVNGYSDGLYHPELPVNRDQMAAFIANGDNSLLSRVKVYPTYLP